MSLRPREYFNLASRHGMTYHLHDDFYDNEGIAYDPKVDVVNDPALTFSTLDELHDLHSIVGYAIIEWSVSNAVVQAIKRFTQEEILEELDRRIMLNRVSSERVYELAALTLGRYAEAWVLRQWQERTDQGPSIYGMAIARCVDPEVGFALYSREVERVQPPNMFSWAITWLIEFRSAKSLAWIEANIGRVTNIADAWGYLAVASQFDWPTAKRWLDGGRPLSLVALDALANCAVTAEDKYSTAWLQKNPQRLLNSDAVEEMNRVLLAYCEKDNVTRVRSKVSFIIDSWDKILKR